MIRRAVLWSAAALLGIALTAVLAWAASQLAGQRIGLASAPPSVAHDLQPGPSSRQPPHDKETGRGRAAGVAAAPRVSQSVPAPSAPATTSTASLPAAVTPAQPPPSTTSGAPASLPTTPSTAPSPPVSQPTPTAGSGSSASSSHGRDDSHGRSGDGAGKASHRDD